MIKLENWTHCHYKSLQLKAFLSFGADLPKDGQESAPLLYFVTVTDHDHQEVFQTSFTDLSEALISLNNKYGHWELIDAEKGSSDSGCSSCSAH